MPSGTLLVILIIVAVLAALYLLVGLAIQREFGREKPETWCTGACCWDEKTEEGAYHPGSGQPAMSLLDRIFTTLFWLPQLFFLL